MDRIIAPYTVTQAQADTAPTTGTPGYATDGNPATNTAATQWPAYQYNAIQEELIGVITGAGLTPDRTALNQLLLAIRTISAASQGTLVDTGTANTYAAANIVPLTVSTLTHGVRQRVTIAHSNSGASTYAPDGLAAKPIYGLGLQPLQGLELIATQIADLEYVVAAALNGGNGAWLILNCGGGAFQVPSGSYASTPAAGDSSAKLATTAFVDNASASIQGGFKNLSLSATGTNANISVNYDELALTDGAGSWLLDIGVSGATINTTTVGAGGLDTGALAASTWYSVWRIAQVNGTKSWLISLSPIAPTMPAGYTLKARIGWIRTDGTANKYPLSFSQFGRRVNYKVASASNIAGLPQISAGASSGSVTTPTYTAAAIGSFVPTTASRINVTLSIAAGAAMAAPNNSYGAYNSTSNPPPLSINTPSGGAGAISGDITIESANIYFASNTTYGLCCYGWEDNF